MYGIVNSSSKLCINNIVQSFYRKCQARKLECGIDDWERDRAGKVCKRRNIGILCVQETKWTYKTARELEQYVETEWG